MESRVEVDIKQKSCTLGKSKKRVLPHPTAPSMPVNYCFNTFSCLRCKVIMDYFIGYVSLSSPSSSVKYASTDLLLKFTSKYYLSHQPNYVRFICRWSNFEVSNYRYWYIIKEVISIGLWPVLDIDII